MLHLVVLSTLLTSVCTDDSEGHAYATEKDPVILLLVATLVWHISLLASKWIKTKYPLLNITLEQFLL